MRLSIIIPTLDEESALDVCLPHALAMADEVWVSDGGSRDLTRDVAAAHGARWTEGPAGRGGQLNRGARCADGDVLLFLHADSRLPTSARQAIEDAIEAGAPGGAFHVRYVNGGKLLDGLGNRLVRWRTRVSRLPLGDQGQFVTRQAFDHLGGFEDWPILEDLDFMRRLRRDGAVVLDHEIESSGRQFKQQGVARTIATNWLIWALYFFGVPPHRLARLYRNIR